MIESINIENLGVIQSTELTFGTGLTVLTGETGAGKTMVLTSLHLLLGRRADPAVVRTGSVAAIVDGIFTIPPNIADEVRQAGGKVEDDELIISRTIPTQGRSRARMGSRPVPASVLAEILEKLVTIHGQADQLQLKTPASQCEALDAFGGQAHGEILRGYQQAWAAAVAAKRALDASLTTQDDRIREIEMLSAVVEAIDNLGIEPGEEEFLRAETERLTNIEDLRSDVGHAHTILSEAQGNAATDLLRAALDHLRHALRYDRSLHEYEERLESARLDVEAIAEDLSTYLRRLEADPQRLAELHDRRAALRELMRGRATDTFELLEWSEKASARLKELTIDAVSPEECEEVLKRAQQRVLDIGRELSISRKEIAERLSQDVTTELHGLAMPNSQFHIDLHPGKPTPHGLETVQFLLQPHPEMTPTPLGQGASGGELSRVMLALEVTLGARSGTPTYVFDEVDAGIGGRTATEVGRRLALLAEHKQVIVVTHLAQVAAWASTHLVVEKDGATTTVRPVQGKDRVEEIARMMGANEGSDVARRHAKELLEDVNVPQSKGE